MPAPATVRRRPGRLSSRGRRGKSAKVARVWRRRSGSLEIVVPHVEVHRVARRRALAPQLARGESDGIDVLAFLTRGNGRWCRERCTRRGRARRRRFLPRAYRGRRVWPVGIDVAGAHALAHLEQRPNVRLVARGDAARRASGTTSPWSTAGVALAEPGAALPLSISSLVTRPYCTTCAPSLCSHRS